MKKVIVCLLMCCILMTLFTGCAEKAPTTIDFYNYTDVDLFKLTNQKVTIYGYFLLNPVQNNTAYISNMPYIMLSNPQQSGSTTIDYAKIGVYENGVISVHFKETPKYTSKPIKITGTLEAGPFYDAYYFSYNYRIKNAVIEEIDIAYMEPSLQIFSKMAEQGYYDVIYQRILDLEIFITEAKKEFPKFEEYEKIKKDFEGKTPNVLETEYLELLKELNDVYEKYSKLYGTDEYDVDVLQKAIENVYTNFQMYIVSYGCISPVK